MSSSTIVGGDLEDFGVAPPRVLAMTDDAPVMGTGDPLADHLVTTLGVDEATARCMVEQGGEALVPNEFAVLSFAAMYTDDRRALADAVSTCTPPTALAANLITSDAELRDCITAEADPESAALVSAAVAAAAITSVEERWGDWLPAARECLDVDRPTPAATPETSQEAAPQATPLPWLTNPQLRIASLLSPPPEWEFVPMEIDSEGAVPVVQAEDDGHAAVAFEVHRVDTATPDALVWAIAWDPDVAVDRAFSESWLTWTRSDQTITETELAGVPVELLVDPDTGIEQYLIVVDGLALVVSDTGGGESALEAILYVALG